MSIEDTKLIDFAGRDRRNGNACLSISDHLPWDDANQEMHLKLLQEKIYTYLDFIESGEIYERYPSAEGLPIVIEIIAKYPLSDSGKTFFDKMAAYVRDLGFGLEFRLFEPTR